MLTERASGRAVWRGRRKAYKVDGSLVTLNAFAFASVDDFRRTAVSAISEGWTRCSTIPASGPRSGAGEPGGLRA